MAARCFSLSRAAPNTVFSGISTKAEAAKAEEDVFS
jgi:hypothetical protein